MECLTLHRSAITTLCRRVYVQHLRFVVPIRKAEGRDGEADLPALPAVTDSCLLRVLDGPLVLDGEKLSYGWDDLAARAAPEFLTEETEPDLRYQGRLFWPAPFRDELLVRLLDLNCARAAEERALGLSPSRTDEVDLEFEDTPA